MQHRADVPEVVENVACVRDENGRKLAIIVPGAGDGVFVDLARGFVEEERRRRDVGLRPVETNVTLALLLGIVERVSVEKRPDKLPADVLQAEFEMRMLIDGVVAAVKTWLSRYSRAACR